MLNITSDCIGAAVLWHRRKVITPQTRSTHCRSFMNINRNHCHAIILMNLIVFLTSLATHCHHVLFLSVTSRICFGLYVSPCFLTRLRQYRPPPNEVGHQEMAGERLPQRIPHFKFQGVAKPCANCSPYAGQGRVQLSILGQKNMIESCFNNP